MKQFKKWNFDDIVTGLETEATSFSFSEEDIENFANLSGDKSPLHTSDSFAVGKGYKEKLVHGLLLVSKFSYLVGMVLPGEDCLDLAVEIRFHRPVYANEKCTIKGTVIGKSDSTKILDMKIEIFKASGELAAGGVSKVRVI